MISLVPFKHKYFNDLVEMLKNQNYDQLEYISMKTLPKIGYICLLEGTQEILAAGFLRRVEGGFGQLDTFGTNPYFGSKIRHKALTLIVEALMKEASDIGITGVLAITQDEGIKRRAIERGFAVINQTLLGINNK